MIKTDAERKRIKSSIDFIMRYVAMIVLSVLMVIILYICLVGSYNLRVNEGNDFGKMINGTTIVQIKRIERPYAFIHNHYYEVTYIDQKKQRKTTNLYNTKNISIERSSDGLCHATVKNGLITLYSPQICDFESK